MQRGPRDDRGYDGEGTETITARPRRVGRGPRVAVAACHWRPRRRACQDRGRLGITRPGNDETRHFGGRRHVRCLNVAKPAGRK
jgi:hypothetical protein